MRAHVIANGKIVNTIKVQSLGFMPNLIDADLHPGNIGDLWDGETVTPVSPTAILPNSLPRWVVHKILKKHSLFGTVNSTINSIMDADLKETFQVAFSEHPDFRRVSPFIDYLIDEEVFTDQAEVDEYFLEGKVFMESPLFSQE